jgi:hypothetical protein
MIDGGAAFDAAADPGLLLAVPLESPQAHTTAAAGPIIKGPVLTSVQSYVLHAAAIDVCEHIVSHAYAMNAAGRGAPWLKDVMLPDLDIWLWAIAKDRADYHALPRFILRNTPFF